MQNSRQPIRANGLGDILGGRGSIILIALVGLFIYWQSNQKEVPFAPGKKQFNTLSVADEIKLGEQSYLQILQQEQGQGNTVLCADEASCRGDARLLTERVREIGARLEQAALELENDYRLQGYEMPGVVAVQLDLLCRRFPDAQRLLPAGRLCGGLYRHSGYHRQL